MIPSFLQKLAHKILQCGKYLNVFRECGKDVKYPNETEIRISVNSAMIGAESSNSGSIINHKTFSEPIENAYQFAS